MGQEFLDLYTEFGENACVCVCVYALKLRMLLHIKFVFNFQKLLSI